MLECGLNVQTLGSSIIKSDFTRRNRRLSVSCVIGDIVHSLTQALQ